MNEEENQPLGERPALSDSFPFRGNSVAVVD